MADLLTIAETADYLRVSVRQVRRYIHDGRLRCIRIGYRTVLIRRREVDVFLKKRMNGGWREGLSGYDWLVQLLLGGCRVQRQGAGRGPSQ